MVRYYCNKCGYYHKAGVKVPSIFKKHVNYRDKPFGDYPFYPTNKVLRR
jgi:hypothetical protein